MARVTPPAKAPPVTPRTDFGDKVKAHQRYYTSSGEQVPGVTTVLGVLNKPALVPWANRLGLQGIDTSKYVDEAASVGTLAHYLIECRLKEEMPLLDDYTPAQLERAQYGVHAFNKWLSGHDLKPLAVEVQLVSDEHRYGGTIDLVALIDGLPELVDIKTGSGIWPEHEYQVGAYWKLLEESGQHIEGARILRIGRTEGEGMEERILTGVQVLNGWRLFQHCLAIHRLKKR